ncbi:hypothetical protein dsx2_0566 [Desulfovibrio sp. X2]|uniref:hypothetical protein n=1 Tax=Desulfovibrio sp. X2 TaxID=941449 RepID=UPI00035899ED|nr:hypothetical protein [Desulfovibrio sp. X2]EPR37634.1 hypothetical protein dsx2_0566 [Desulfovibrio sp. X2]
MTGARGCKQRFPGAARVLVCGGDFEARSAVAEAVRAAGAEVAEAAGTAEALRLLALAGERGGACAVSLVLDLDGGPGDARGGGLAARAAAAFPEGHPPIRRVEGPAEAVEALISVDVAGGMR